MQSPAASSANGVHQEFVDEPPSRDPFIALGKQRAPTPPPLPVKPPADYYMRSEENPTASNGNDFFGANQQREASPNFIDVRPFSPFNVDYGYATPPPPPPLPPKPVM